MIVPAHQILDQWIRHNVESNERARIFVTLIHNENKINKNYSLSFLLTNENNLGFTLFI